MEIIAIIWSASALFILFAVFFTNVKDKWFLLAFAWLGPLLVYDIYVQLTKKRG